MKKSIFLTAILLGLLIEGLSSQTIELKKDNLEPIGVTMTIDKYMGKEAVKVIKNSDIQDPDQPTYVKIKDIDFQNGTIELNVYSKLIKDAGKFARGFLGVAFRINEDDSKFECIYLRPANARSDDQLRRNHSIQYFSFPDYNFFRLRKETPGKYESYADMSLDEWIKIKIVVKEANAKLYINNSEQPCLIVNDLKHGESLSGSIGFWVDSGTEGFFSDLKIAN